MALPDLGKMSDADYKALSPRDLARYNVDLPKLDYENQYTHQSFPMMLYKVITEENGDRALDSVTITEQKEFDRLAKDGWKRSPRDFGIETAPAAPKLTVARHSIPLPRVDVTAEAAPAK
jgi:hypothetical protein